jgi:hypothetical protein
MGSNIVSVGNRAGKSVFTFAAAGVDTGSLMAPVANGGDLLAGLRECARWTKWMFQLIGTGTGYAVTIYGTLDPATAYNEPGNGGYWFELPAPSTESGVGDAFVWTNPLTLGVGTSALYVNAPIVAVRAVSAGTVTGTVELLVFAQPG